VSEHLPPDIGLLAIEGTPDSWTRDFESEIYVDDLRVASESHNGGPYAGLALYLPTAIGIFIASSYFGGAFKKLGEEHYIVIKEAILKLWRRASKIRVSGIGLAEKVSDFERYQLSYSISSRISDRLTFKLVLKMDLSEAASEQAILTFLDTIRDIHLGCIDSATLERLVARRPMAGIVVVTFDPKKMELVPAD
jgi:hypothetical protein